MIFQLTKNFKNYQDHTGEPSVWRKAGLIVALMLRRIGFSIVIHHNDYDRKFMRLIK